MIKKFLKNLIKNNTMFFVLLMITVVVSTLILNFSYGLYQNYHTLKAESVNDNYYTNLLIRDDTITKGELEEFILSICEDTNAHINLWSIDLYENGDKNNRYPFGICVKNGRITQSEKFADNILASGFLKSGSYFTKKQEESGELVALICPPENLEGLTNYEYEIKTFDIEDNKTEIFGKTYEIIGTHGYAYMPFVPFKSVPDDVNVLSCSMGFDNIMTKSQYNELKDITEAYWGGRVVMPNIRIIDNQDIYKYNTVMLVAAVISIISGLNIAVLYKYILIRRRKTLSIFRICGCTKFKAVCLYIEECLCFIIPFYIISLFVFHYKLLTFFSKYYKYMSSAYSLKVYAVIFMIYIILSIAVLLFTILKESRKSLAALSKEEV